MLEFKRRKKIGGNEWKNSSLLDDGQRRWLSSDNGTAEISDDRSGQGICVSSGNAIVREGHLSIAQICWLAENRYICHICQPSCPVSSASAHAWSITRAQKRDHEIDDDAYGAVRIPRSCTRFFCR